MLEPDQTPPVQLYARTRPVRENLPVPVGGAAELAGIKEGLRMGEDRVGVGQRCVGVDPGRNNIWCAVEGTYEDGEVQTGQKYRCDAVALVGTRRSARASLSSAGPAAFRAGRTAVW